MRQRLELAWGLFCLAVAALNFSACMLPWLFRDGAMLGQAWLPRLMHHLQTVALLAGIGLSAWHEGLRLPLLAAMLSGAAHWHRLVLGTCPLTWLEIQLSADARRQQGLQRYGYFVYTLHGITGWSASRRQVGGLITAMLATMLVSWVLV
jgi:hypothetical protein